ncbi:unnamed protein product [Ceutorhynchus assimilis]|uniref:PH domain-containing protein n=1 Tax=Ceutorhynchus assimilis TaxID=467358 RepID=A0A9N9MKK0_9CUCU|nr:unnamed protein product [Ceutorhynchus assimilis]
MSEIASRRSSLSLNKSATESEQSLILACTNEDINNADLHNNNEILTIKTENINSPTAEYNNNKATSLSINYSHKGSIESVHSTPNEEKQENAPSNINTESLEHNNNKGTLLSINQASSRKGSIDSVHSAPVVLNVEKPTQSRIIMGKKDLLRSRSNEMRIEDPAKVVHELVNEKYQDKIEHYITRIYHRRQSRESSKSFDDDGASSDYSATSLRTPDSLYDGKSYFSLFFPPKSETDMDFLNSTQDLDEPATDEVFNSTADANLSTATEFDPKKFLKNALGDISYESQSMDVSFKNSKLQYSQSVDPLNTPSLLSRAGTFYSSVRKSLRRACSFVEKNKPNETFIRNNRRERCQSSFIPDLASSTENLMRELYVQNGTILQVSKALEFCKNSKDMTSSEYIEAEKILLVASCQKEAIQTAIDAAEFEEKEPTQTCSGTLEISDLTFYIKSDSTTEQESPTKKLDEHFVIVVTSGKTVLASQVLVADDDGNVKSDKKFHLSELATYFGASVAIYSMKVKHDKNLDSKHRKKDRKLPCPSTKNFFNLHSHKSSRKNLLVDSISSIKPSSFTLLGSCAIRCSDLEKTHFRMHHVPLSSSLEGYFTATLNASVKLNNRTSGFLTIGFEDKSHPTWNRRWCVLEGSLLRYWNYPSEEFSCAPIGTIDLANATEKSSAADRCVCPRPKSLCLLIKNTENVVLKYFLSADNLEEKLGWLEEINLVIGTLTVWKCLRSMEKTSSM